ncbi:Maph124 [Matsumuraeses phaseoli granulovirus]|uniref:Maph124 n=1 Tax=Matsumuraeses phaseoli granulovirus TaxID=2760664 RepID=A0AAE7MLI1_9BBAC|nr:Maph124 [Matsumuraeses phaseoli granulovirus]QOD40087.1 Maph124 [Matsumuraeses phaseoli granulovirus]
MITQKIWNNCVNGLFLYKILKRTFFHLQHYIKKNHLNTLVFILFHQTIHNCYKNMNKNEEIYKTTTVVIHKDKTEETNQTRLWFGNINTCEVMYEALAFVTIITLLICIYFLVQIHK